MGKAIREKFFWDTVGKKFQTGNVYLSTEQEDYSCQYVDDIKLAGKKKNIDPMCVKYF